MRFAIAGCGGAGKRGHLPALMQLGDDARVVGVADPSHARRADVRERVPDVAVFETAQEMLEQVAPDVLVVATEPHAHAALVELGMSHGAHVICEKPLTLDVQGHRAIRRACARRPDLALIPVHQYRYAQGWKWIAWWARGASVLHVPFALTIEHDRTGSDPHAATHWRRDIASGGGMLGDVAVHFFALGWSIDRRLDPFAVVRERDETGQELTVTLLRVGSGVLTIRTRNRAPARQTQMTISARRLNITWDDDSARLVLGRRTLCRRRAPDLSRREYVDDLYLSLYRDLVSRLHDKAWRVQQTAEALCVGRLVVQLLEQAEDAADER